MAAPEHDSGPTPGTDPGFDLEQGLFSHLIELRARLIKAIACVAVLFIGLIGFANHLYTWLAEPLVKRLPQGAHMIATQVASPFLTPLKLAFYVALFVSMPVIVYQLWAFVSPGLYRREKRLARPLLVASVLLFYCGCAFAYFVVLPAAFHFLTAVTPKGVEMMTDITHYLDFVTMVLFAFGLCFEIPVVEVIVAATGLVSLRKLKSWRRYVIVLAAVVAAAITPPDITSMLLLLIPMVALYEVGLVAVRVLVKPKPDRDAAGEAP
ncbi:MAG: twin-arginine translocase subunit TatC [Rhodanobacteraceae bacterium]|nr:MAG: twin-arginine translocase subunit TatC [Rhodanobacteraceae bacterium]